MQKLQAALVETERLGERFLDLRQMVWEREAQPCNRQAYMDAIAHKACMNTSMRTVRTHTCMHARAHTCAHAYANMHARLGANLHTARKYAHSVHAIVPCTHARAQARMHAAHRCSCTGPRGPACPARAGGGAGPAAAGEPRGPDGAEEAAGRSGSTPCGRRQDVGQAAWRGAQAGPPHGRGGVASRCVYLRACVRAWWLGLRARELDSANPGSSPSARGTCFMLTAASGGARGARCAPRIATSLCPTACRARGGGAGAGAHARGGEAADSHAGRAGGWASERGAGDAECHAQPGGPWGRQAERLSAGSWSDAHRRCMRDAAGTGRSWRSVALSVVLSLASWSSRSWRPASVD